MPLFDIARAVEDQFHRDSVPVLKRQGWRPRVIPYDGYGTSTPAQSEPSDLPGPTSRRHRRPVHTRTEAPTARPLPRILNPSIQQPRLRPLAPPPWPGSWLAW